MDKPVHAQIDIDPVEFVMQTVGDAARFHDTEEVLKAFLWPLSIFIVRPSSEYIVIAYDPKFYGVTVFEQHFPTYAQALSSALTEAQKRIKETPDAA